MTDKQGGEKKKVCICVSERERERDRQREIKRENGRVMQSEPEFGSSRLFQPRYDPALTSHPINLQLF